MIRRLSLALSMHCRATQYQPRNSVTEDQHHDCGNGNLQLMVTEVR
jgi:hypothetical protein